MMYRNMFWQIDLDIQKELFHKGLNLEIKGDKIFGLPLNMGMH